MYELPKDPALLLSVVNMQLRDKEPNLSMLAGKMGTSAEAIIEKLGSIGYHYNAESNSFI